MIIPLKERRMEAAIQRLMGKDLGPIQRVQFLPERVEPQVYWSAEGEVEWNR